MITDALRQAGDYQLLTLYQPGACALAAKEARSQGNKVSLKEVRFTTFARRAIMAALSEIFSEAEMIYIFWDSKNSGHAVELARRSGRPLKVWGPEGEMPDWESGGQQQLC